MASGKAAIYGGDGCECCESGPPPSCVQCFDSGFRFIEAVFSGGTLPPNDPCRVPPVFGVGHIYSGSLSGFAFRKRMQRGVCQVLEERVPSPIIYDRYGCSPPPAFLQISYNLLSIGVVFNETPAGITGANFTILPQGFFVSDGSFATYFNPWAIGFASFPPLQCGQSVAIQNDNLQNSPLLTGGTLTVRITT